MHAISVEQLIRSPGKLIEDAENGRLAVVTKAGRPLFLAVPYDERLAGEDVHVAVAVRLYESDAVSLGRAARIAGFSTSEFIDQLGALQIPVIRYSAEELERELAAFGRDRRRGRGTADCVRTAAQDRSTRPCVRKGGGPSRGVRGNAVPS
jgi:predicted HTH domain antitoxin